MEAVAGPSGNKQLMAEVMSLKEQLKEAQAQLESAKHQQGEHTHSVQVEYIMIEKESIEAGRKITKIMQELDQEKSDKSELEFKLSMLTMERAALHVEKGKEDKKLFLPEMQKREKELD